MGYGLMNLTKAGRGRGFLIKMFEFILPVRPKLGLHPAPDKGPAHRRGIGL